MPITDETLTQLNEYVWFGWLAENEIAHFKVTSTHPDAINTWADKLIEIMTDWPEDRPMLHFNDYSDITNFMTTPLLRESDLRKQR